MPANLPVALEAVVPRGKGVGLAAAVVRAVEGEKMETATEEAATAIVTEGVLAAAPVQAEAVMVPEVRVVVMMAVAMVQVRLGEREA